MSAVTRLARRMRELVSEEHSVTGSGSERFKVSSLAPLVLDQISGTVTLTEGDPDFTIGGWMRQYMVNYGLQLGDEVWCLREGVEWHLIDVTDPGGIVKWDTGTPGD